MATKKTKTEEVKATEETKVETAVAADVETDTKDAKKTCKEIDLTNYPEVIRASLLKTKREGMEDLLDFMEEPGFSQHLVAVATTFAKKGACRTFL